MMIFDELRHISQYFEELVREGKKQVTDLYELVQHAGNVLPRLCDAAHAMAWPLR